MKKLLFFVLLVLSVLGLWAGLALNTSTRIWVADQLIEFAWMRTKAGEQQAKPWPWMASYPVAKLTIPEHNKTHVIFHGMDGDVMAFAPGWHDGTDPLGQPGISLVSAHKDTDFSYLKDVKIGETVKLETPDGKVLSYHIEGTRIVQGAEIEVPNEGHGNVLLLSTAYPYENWQIGGVMQFVVIARQDDLVLAALSSFE